MTETLLLPGSLVVNVRLGRGQDCDLVLSERSVSRVHALLNGTPNGWWITDGGSRNGTWINGDRVQPGVSCPLFVGDVLKLGDARFIVTADAPHELDNDPTTEVLVAAVAGLAALSPYQQDVVRAMSAGCKRGDCRPASNAEIASRLGTPHAVGAVKAALRRAYANVGLTSEADADKRRALCRLARDSDWLRSGGADRHLDDRSH